MKRRRIVILLALAVIAGGSWWFFLPGRTGLAKQPQPGVLASGFIEAQDIAIAPETGGRIVAISAAEGDEIRAGAVLMRLDDSLLKAQERQAEATVRLSRAVLDQATSALDQATISRDGARKILENALDVQRNPLELEARITAARNELNTSEVALGYDTEIDRYRGVPKSTYWTVAFATQRRDNARAMLQSLLDIKSHPQEINGAVERARAAHDAAAAAVDVAGKAVVIAERQVEQATASLDVIRAQSARLTIASPISGRVAARNAEVGEVVQPGVPVLTVTDTDDLTLTAFVPESQLGLVRIGQAALVTVDSYPDSEFTGRVVNIGTRALFTPKNVQLKEEREKTMYPVKIKIANPERKLKAGMPADVRIVTG